MTIYHVCLTTTFRGWIVTALSLLGGDKMAVYIVVYFEDDRWKVYKDVYRSRASADHTALMLTEKGLDTYVSFRMVCD